MKWWDTIRNNQSEIRMIFTVNDVPAGFCKFYRVDMQNRNCVLGADLHKDFRGQGLASTMWNLMLETCFQNLQLNRVSLSSAVYNDIAQRVYRKVGFKEEGRLVKSLFRGGEYHDQICMYMLRDDWKGTQQ